jgi:hypothetical protein
MLFTLIIWVLSILKLASAVVLYLVFLFHHIPEEDGTLKAYCRRKISTRLKRIVQQKVNKALAKGFQLQDRAPTQPTFASQDSKPTLPDLGKGFTLSRSATETTLPPYTRTNSNITEKNPTLPNLEFDSKPPLTRTTTQSSGVSESAFLTGNGTMGYSPLDRQTTPLPPVPPLPATVPPPRTGSAMSRPTPGPTPGPTPFANDPGRGTPAAGYRNLTDSGTQPYRTFTPANDPYARSNTPNAPVPDDYRGRSHTPAADPYARSNTPGAPVSYDSYGRSNTPARYNPYGAQNNGYGVEDPYGAHAYDHDQDEYGDWSGASPSRSHPQPGYPPRDEYRSYTPASTGVRPTPGGPTGRTMTPASYRSTPGPQSSAQVQPPLRTFTPMSPESPNGSQNSGYAAFNPPVPSQTPQPRMQMSPSPTGYQPFTRANTASPSTMHRNGPPAGYSFNRANTDQF